MPTEVSARVVLQEKVRFVGSASGAQSIVIDYPPPLGDDTGVRGGLELLLMSVAACAGQTVVALLRRLRQPPSGCMVEARGRRRDAHPTVLTEIHVRFGLVGEGLDRTTVERAITLSEEEFCPVWAMLKGSTRLTSSFSINEAEPEGVALPPQV
jgi:putative redox protein